MKRFHLFRSIFVVATFATLVSAGLLRGSTQEPESAVAESSRAQGSSASGRQAVDLSAAARLDRIVESAGLSAQVAVIDPATGTLTSRRPPGVVSGLGTESSRGPSAAELKEEALPGGGFKVRLEGRFVSVLMVSAPPAAESSEADDIEKSSKDPSEGSRR